MHNVAMAVTWHKKAERVVIFSVPGGRARTMCPYLVKAPLAECSAGESAYQPSEFELKEYCSGDRYRMCAFYCKRQVADDAEVFLGREERGAGCRPEAPKSGKETDDQSA